MTPTIIVLADADSALARKVITDLQRVAPELMLEPRSRVGELIELAGCCEPALLLLLDDGSESRLQRALQHLREAHPLLPVVVLSEAPTIARAVAAVRLNPRDFLDSRRLSPMQLADKVREHMRRFVPSDGSVPAGRGRHGMIGTSPRMQELFRQIDRAGPSDATVLILGETGTGKELIASALHRVSRRADRDLLPLSCAELPDSLLESELFGFVRGSFTGADRSFPGVFRMANGGTILLDEIGELTDQQQVKLLRLIEKKPVRPLGSSRLVEVDVRIIAATNRDLRAAVERGTFREDLYYRLDTLRIEVPPLRTRNGDIRLLVPHLLAKYATNGEIPEVTEAAMQQLLRAPWRGNVRELQSVVQRALIAPWHGRIDHFQIDQRLDVSPATALDDAAEFQAHLRRHNGSLRELAEEMGVSTRTLQRRAKRFGLDPRQFVHTRRRAARRSASCPETPSAERRRRDDASGS